MRAIRSVHDRQLRCHCFQTRQWTATATCSNVIRGFFPPKPTCLFGQQEHRQSAAQPVSDEALVGAHLEGAEAALLFGAFEPFTICQRANAACMISCSDAAAAALLMKYLTSPVLGCRAMISQYCRSVGTATLSSSCSTRCTRAALTCQITGPRVVSLIVIVRHDCWVNAGLCRQRSSTRRGACSRRNDRQAGLVTHAPKFDFTSPTARWPNASSANQNAGTLPNSSSNVSHENRTPWPSAALTWSTPIRHFSRNFSSTGTPAARQPGQGRGYLGRGGVHSNVPSSLRLTLLCWSWFS